MTATSSGGTESRTLRALLRPGWRLKTLYCVTLSALTLTWLYYLRDMVVTSLSSEESAGNVVDLNLAVSEQDGEHMQAHFAQGQMKTVSPSGVAYNSERAKFLDKLGLTNKAFALYGNTVLASERTYDGAHVQVGLLVYVPSSFLAMQREQLNRPGGIPIVANKAVTARSCFAANNHDHEPGWSLGLGGVGKPKKFGQHWGGHHRRLGAEEGGEELGGRDGPRMRSRNKEAKLAKSWSKGRIMETNDSAPVIFEKCGGSDGSGLVWRQGGSEAGPVVGFIFGAEKKTHAH